MDNMNTQKIPSKTSKQLWNKTTVTYLPADIWQLFSNMVNGIALKKSGTDKLFDFFLSIGIIVCARIYPAESVYIDSSGNFVNDYQVDQLMCALESAFKYFTEDPQKRVIGYYPNKPISQIDERKFHAHFRNKFSNCWIDCIRKENNDPLQRRIQEIIDSFPDDEIGQVKMKELAVETGVYAAKVSSDQNDSYVFIAERKHSSEAVLNLFNDKYQKMKDSQVKITYLLEHPEIKGTDKEGIVNFLG